MSLNRDSVPCPTCGPTQWVKLAPDRTYEVCHHCHAMHPKHMADAMRNQLGMGEAQFKELHDCLTLVIVEANRLHAKLDELAKELNKVGDKLERLGL